MSKITEAFDAFIAKGDSPGHEFRGNQYGTCTGCGSKSEYKEHFSQATRTTPRTSLGHQAYCPNCKVSFRPDQSAEAQFAMANVHAEALYHARAGDQGDSKWKTGIADLIKGGPGSGDFGHAGREGERGGSGAGGGIPAPWSGGGSPAFEGVRNLRSGQPKASMARADYERIATNIRENAPAEHREAIARDAASIIRNSNPLFNEERFVNASTGKGSTTPGRLGHTKETAAGIREQSTKLRDMALRSHGMPRSGTSERSKQILSQADWGSFDWRVDANGNRMKTGVADLIKDFSVGDGLQDYNLGPGQKRPKRKGKNTKRTSFEQFPRDYVARDKTGIADVVKYTADQKRERGKYVGGSADARMRSGSYRRGILPSMHYHGNQSHTHPNGDTSHGHKPGGL